FKGALAGALLLPMLPVASAVAQEAGGQVSAILTVDQERLYTQSLWGKRAEAEVARKSAELAAENRQIEAQLIDEEKELTAKRPTMPANEFRPLADEFDSRVTGIRQAQDTKAREIAEFREAERKRFFDAALVVMGDVMQERGAVAILDSRAIFLSVSSIDATDSILLAIDKRIGAGPDPLK
ncbi:MAG: OmpH family outer membrane protein, partial [Paracoccaceae bacterium]